MAKGILDTTRKYGANKKVDDVTSQQAYQFQMLKTFLQNISNSSLAHESKK